MSFFRGPSLLGAPAWRTRKWPPTWHTTDTPRHRLASETATSIRAPDARGRLVQPARDAGGMTRGTSAGAAAAPSILQGYFRRIRDALGGLRVRTQRPEGLRPGGAAEAFVAGVEGGRPTGHGDTATSHRGPQYGGRGGASGGEGTHMPCQAGRRRAGFPIAMASRQDPEPRQHAAPDPRIKEIVRDSADPARQRAGSNSPAPRGPQQVVLLRDLVSSLGARRFFDHENRGRGAAGTVRFRVR